MIERVKGTPLYCSTCGFQTGGGYIQELFPPAAGLQGQSLRSCGFRGAFETYLGGGLSPHMSTPMKDLPTGSIGSMGKNAGCRCWDELMQKQPPKRS